MPLTKEVLIGVLNVNASSFAGGTQVHLKSFRESVGIADGILNRLATTTGALKIFVAPEYYFSQAVEMPRRHGGGTKTGYMPVSVDQSQKLIADLVALSGQYPDFLIFAGSIHYMKDGVGKKDTYNACPILAGGTLVHLYHKRQYDNFAEDALTNPGFVGGTESPMFTFGDVRFGIEICLDHGAQHRVLEKHLSSSGEAPPQIQVLVSRGSALGQLNATDLAIHCDMSAGRPIAGIVKLGDGTPIAINQTGRPISDGTCVECFRVPPRAAVPPALPFAGTAGVGAAPLPVGSARRSGH